MTNNVMPVRSGEIAKLAAALAAATKAFAPIPKDREVEVRSDRGNYKFKYATLDAIRSATIPALAEQGLCVVQGMVDHGTTGYAIETTLYHASGEWVANVTPMFVSGRTKDGRTYPPSNQELGSAQSYARRYGLTALLCLAADESLDDGNIADSNQHKPGVPGSAGGGTDFRPPGPRRMPTSDWVNDAVNDGIVDQRRSKGALPPKPANGNGNGNAIKRVEWVKRAIDSFKTASSKDELTEWWKAESERIEVIENAMPAEFERLIAAYDAAIERTARA